MAKRAIQVVSGLALALFCLVPNSRAETLRVATWNLESPAVAGRTNATANTNQTLIQQRTTTSKKGGPPLTKAGGGTNATAGTNPNRIRQAANALKKLDPDVILLQQVRDWQMCEQLAQALKPAEYKILTCSSFIDPRTGTLRKQQVAILSKAKAYLAWSEPWRKEGKTALPGGLAFAALQVGKQRVGLFSVQAGNAPAKTADPEQSAARLKAQAAAVNQLLDQVSLITNWATNQVQALVVGGTFYPGAQDGLAAQEIALRLVEEAGFGSAFPQTSATEQHDPPGGVADYIFTRPAGCALNPRTLSPPAFPHHAMACEVELDPGKAAKAQAVRVESPPPSETSRPARTDEAKTKPIEPAPPPPLIPPGPPAPIPGSQPSTLNPQPLWWAVIALGGIVVAASFAWMLRGRRRAFRRASPTLITQQAEDMASSYTVVVRTRSATEPAPEDESASLTPRPRIHIDAPETHTHAEVLRQRALAAEQRADRATAVIRAGLIPHLSHWLKQKLVRKLVADRAQLLDTQQAATLKALAVEERLSRIEQQIQQQNRAYQERIEELTRELIAAKEDNREMIRDRIAQVRRDMEAARARLMAQSAADDTSVH